MCSVPDLRASAAAAATATGVTLPSLLLLLPSRPSNARVSVAFVCRSQVPGNEAPVVPAQPIANQMAINNQP